MPNASDELFEDLPTPDQPAGPRPRRTPRVLMPNRLQVELRPSDLESLLDEGHTARLVWGFVENQDLSALYAQIRSVDGGPGRDAIAPEILLALWLYATLDGVGSARALARLCETHDAYRWLCGGVRVNHHTLSDFRVLQGAFLDQLLTHSVAALMSTGAVTLKRVAQDGMRVRASAGAASFRRKERLMELHAEARAQVEQLKREVADDPRATERRVQAARERAAREREQHLSQALEQMPTMEARKKAAGKPPDSARVSSTDAQARVMKMPDGGFRPAYNVQFATDTQSQVVAGVDVTDHGADAGQMSVMLNQLKARYATTPEHTLVDGGFTTLADIDRATAHGTTVYGPVPQAKRSTRDRHTPLPRDTEAVAAWRTRMATDEAKAIYKERAATAECVNAAARNRGLQRFAVRGRDKALAVALLFALAHNLARMFALQGAALA